MPAMNWATTAKSVRWILEDAATSRQNMDIDWRFRVGEVVRIRITNSREAFHAMQHPIHLHGYHFTVMARDGAEVQRPYEADTLVVAPGETYDVLVKATQPGVWALHCHILSHVEGPQGMYGMATALVVS